MTVPYQRRIAGSNAYGFKVGSHIRLWKGAKIDLAAHYDDVEYNTEYNNNDNEANGFGGTLSFMQKFPRHLNLNLKTSYREPFNEYTVDGYWSRG